MSASTTPTPGAKPSLKISFKRPSDASMAVPRKKARTSATSTPTDEKAFKIPALPYKATPMLSREHRALSPSTSTVAASSSPRRNLSSSPGPDTHAATASASTSKSRARSEEIKIQKGAALVFGRHRHRPTSSEGPSKTRLESTIPRHLLHLVSEREALAQTVYLAREAKHASRVHALVEYLPALDGAEERVRILVIGQNGLRVDGAKVLAGQRVEIARKEKVKLDFYGARFALRFPAVDAHRQAEPEQIEAEIEEVHRERLFTPDSSPVARAPLSLPPSSPPLAPSTPGDMDIDLHDDEISDRVEARQMSAEEEHDELEALFRSSPPPATRLDSERGSSPLSEASDEEVPPTAEVAEEEDVDEEMLEEEEDVAAEEEEIVAEPAMALLDKEVKTELLETIQPKSRQPSPVEIEPIPSGVDLPALLASTVVFSGSSKLSLPDLVKHMLEVSAKAV